jgi:hypothetical protein
MDPRTEKLLAENAQKMQAIPAPLRGTVRAGNSATRWAKKNPTQTKIAAAAIVVVLLGAHYLFVQLPARRREQSQFNARAADRLKTETVERQTTTDDCLAKAKADADAKWEAACKARREKPGCALASAKVDELDAEEAKARNACLLTRSASR